MPEEALLPKGVFLSTRAEVLEKGIEIARQQRRLLIYEDLTPVFTLQSERDALIEKGLPGGKEPLGKYEKELAAEILKLDREIIPLLTVKLAEVKDQLKELAPFKKMLRACRGLRQGGANKLSCRI